MSHPQKVEITPLRSEVRANLPTKEAAAHLNRSPQTLRQWAAFNSGPIRPLRVNGLLAWPVAELVRITEGRS